MPVVEIVDVAVSEIETLLVNDIFVEIEAEGDGEIVLPFPPPMVAVPTVVTVPLNEDDKVGHALAVFIEEKEEFIDCDFNADRDAEIDAESEGVTVFDRENRCDGEFEKDDDDV